jgi:hypothetical protein
MKLIAISILPLLLMATLTSAEDLQTAKVAAVKAYKHGRIAYWEGRVPIYDDYPFYDITLTLGQKKQIVRYESLSGYYPSSWKVGSEIKVRPQGKGRIYLLDREEEVSAEIVNVRAQNCVPSSGPPVTLSVGPQVPCE